MVILMSKRCAKLRGQKKERRRPGLFLAVLTLLTLVVYDIPMISAYWAMGMSGEDVEPRRPEDKK
jgi:hypothetical protein